MEGLSLICAGLGIIEEDDNGNRIGYSKGEFCLDNLRDLLRFLRRDDPQTREVFKQICKWNTVGKDLIPIIERCQDDSNLVLHAVKVLVFLTMPIESTSDDIAQQIEYLWGVKSAITFSDIVPVILSLLEKPLEKLDSETFAEDDWKLVQLVLTLFRNLLAIQEISTQQKAGGSATEFLSLRDRFLELLFQENVMDLLVALAQHVGGSCTYFRQDNLLLLETFHYVFMGQEPELIAQICSENSKEDESAKTSLQGLNYIMQDEQEKRKLNRMRNLASYSLFSGTFTRFALDGSKTLCKGNPSFKSGDALLKANKNHRGPSKRTVWDHGRLPSLKTKTLQLLYDFIDQFLSGGYNALMQSIREDIEKEHHAIQNNDVVIFFQVAWFVTSFQYHKFLNTKFSNDVARSMPIDNHADSTLFRGNICGPIAETLNESMFLVLISKWRFAFDALKETNDYILLSAAGSVLKIMIRLLDLVLKQSLEDSMEPKTARVLLYKLFYDQTEEGITQSLINMIKSFDTHRQAKSDLADLVETLHVVFRLMENLQTRGALRVYRRSRKKKTKKDMVDGSVREDVPDQHEVTGPGNEQFDDVSNVGKVKSVVHDSTCNVNEDPSQASEHTEIEAEMEKLRSNMPEVEEKVSHDQGTDNSSGDEQQAITDEVDFNMYTLVSALTNQNIIKNLCWLLKFYKSNSLGTNHYIICMLRRVCEDLELSPMLYQLSFLNTFYDILEEQKSKPCQEHENIVLFLTNLVRRMLRKMKTRPLLFVEVLFCKTRKECHLINAECMLNELGSLKKDVREGMLNGETGLSGGQGWVRRSIADALGDDEADFTTLHQEVGEKDENPNDTNFKVLNSKEERESVISSTDDANTENDIKGGNRVKRVSEALDKRRKSLVLDGEVEGKIRDLYEKYKKHENCYHLIANAIEEDGPKVSPHQVSRILKKLGFKLTRKKGMFPSSFPDQLNLDDSFSSRKPLHTRKRVRAFSEDQEQRIKDLFEQFKDQRRCSSMIAAALDAEGTISARQVSYKLKQLGLSVSRKKLDTNFQLRDDDSSEDSAGCADSDDEPLISLKRSKKQKVTEFVQKQKEEIARNLSEDDSEDELPSPVKSNTFEQPAGVRSSEMDLPALDHARFAETGGISIVKQSDMASMEEADDMLSEDMHDKLADELADFEDETSVESQKYVASPSRRHLRMIMDLEDDE